MTAKSSVMIDLKLRVNYIPHWGNSSLVKEHPLFNRVFKRGRQRQLHPVLGEKKAPCESGLEGRKKTLTVNSNCALDYRIERTIRENQQTQGRNS